MLSVKMIWVGWIINYWHLRKKFSAKEVFGIYTTDKLEVSNNLVEQSTLLR